MLKQCINGDKKAQLMLYKKYATSMFYTSLSIVRNSAVAEDVVQESFISVFKNLTSFKKEVSFGAWMKKIVINRSISVLKKEQKFILSLEQEQIHASIAEEETFEQETEIVPARLKNAMKRLSDKYHVVISLYYLEGYDNQEISEILGISNDNVRAILSRARAKLKKLMEN